MSYEPGADELRIRSILLKNGVGPDAESTVPPAPPGVGPDTQPERRPWWSHERPWAKTTADQQPHEHPDPGEETDDEDDQEEQPRAFQPQPDYWPRPHTPAFVHRTRDRAETAISPGTRRLLYNASAAGAGWGLGLYQQFAHALVDCGTHYSISGALVLGAGSSALIAHLWDRRTRHWWPGIAWAARIPLATALLALALWAPASAA